MAGQTRPNILLIYSDQHRYDCLGVDEHPLVETPALSRLARQGVSFSRAFTSTPACCPARQSLLCGKWAETHGGLWNYDLGLPVRLFAEPTWSEAFARHGYRLGHVGKWHVHPQKTPLAFGFHDYVPLTAYDAWRRESGLPEYQPTLDQQVASVVHPSVHKFFGGRDPVPLAQTRTHWLAQRAIDMAKRYARGDQPWHIRLNFKEPHLPCYPAEPFFGRYDPADIPPWGSFAEEFADKPYIQQQQLESWRIGNLTWSEMSHFVARYLGMISQVDDAIGLLLQALEALGLADSTVVIYSTDHGGLAGAHRMLDKHMVMYDDVVHVPLVIRGPGIAPAAVTDEFVSVTVDLASTICDLAKVGVPEGFQGRSFASMLSGDTPGDWPQDIVATYNGNQFGLFVQRMLRNERWKYVWNPTAIDELYDLQADPWELVNLVADRRYSDILASMRRRLLERLRENGDRMVLTNWMQAQLAEGCKLGSR